MSGGQRCLGMNVRGDILRGGDNHAYDTGTLFATKIVPPGTILVAKIVSGGTIFARYNFCVTVHKVCDVCDVCDVVQTRELLKTLIIFVLWKAKISPRDTA